MRYKCENCSAINVMAAGDEGSEIACGRCNQPIVVPETDVAPGVVYGDFAIQGVLAERTHETDYKATQLSLKRDVILKVVDDELSGNEAFAKLFLTASRKASTLSHPFLCQTVAAGRENGKYYLARELGGNRSLRSILVADGHMEWGRAARLACDLALALDHAWTHAKLAHFNVKPDYVVVCDGTHARLADVGLAGLNPEPDSDRIIGTPQYISPERIVGMEGDNRSDLYSLGVTLFYMVTGHFPFDAKSSSEYIEHHLNSDPIAADTFEPDLPKAFCDVLTVLLNKNPNMRYQSGDQLVGDLRALLDGRAPVFAAQAIQMQPAAEPKPAIAKDDDVDPPAAAEQQQVSPDIQFDDLDNFFEDLEMELERETQTLTPDFSMPTDEFDALIEDLDDDGDDDEDGPDSASPEPPIKMAMPVAQPAGPTAIARPATAMPVAQAADDDDDDDIPMVTPIAVSTPVQPVYDEQDELAEEVDALFNEPASSMPVAEMPQNPVGSFPAMTDDEASQPKPGQKKSAAAKKKKKFSTRIGKKTNVRIRRK